MRSVIAVVCVAGLLSSLQAGEYNKKLSVGDPAPAWSKLPGTDGKEHSLDDFKGKEVVVVVFTCNHCPIAAGYEDRIINFTKKYAASADSKVAVVALNVNNYSVDKMDKMMERAKEKKFNFPYLHDESQKIGREYGATVTPEFFVMNKERKIVYMGAMDDDDDEDAAKVNYLEQAVQATLKGTKLEKTEVRARGCSVQYEKKK